MKNKVLLGIIFTLSSLILTGCWDNVEINERHVVLEVALDKCKVDNVDANIQDRAYYQITYMIPDIGKLSGENSLAENVKTAMVAKSPTIAKSIDDIESKTQNTISFSHTKALIFGEELIKDKKLFRAAIESLIRNREISRGINILAVKGKAEDIVQSNNYQNPVIGLYIMKYFNNTERATSHAKQQVLGNMVKEIQNTNITTIPVIEKEEEGILKIGGAAVIKNYELVGWLDEDEVRGQLFIDGSIHKVPIVVEYEGDYLTYQIEHQKRTINFKRENELQTMVKIIVKGSITEYNSSKNQYVFNEEKIKEISKLIQQEIEREIEKTINTSKMMNIDFLNIGLEMYRKEPQLWKMYKTNWERDTYKKLPIQLNVEVMIQNTGILE